MSGLIFKGDVVQSTGEYLPAPYINKITAFQDRDEEEGKYCDYSVQIYLFADDYSYVDVQESTDIKGSQEAYRDYLNGFNYYIMAVSGLTQEVYDNLTMGKLNPLVFYKDFVDNKDDTFAYANGDARLYRFQALSSDNPVDIYDETGNRVVVYPTDITATEINTSLLTNSFNRFDQNVEYIFCFCSLFNYDNDSELLTEENFNIQLLNLQTGDVSYERFYSSGGDNELEVQESAKFYDAENILYDKTPLASVDRDIYKILNLTHDDIKDSMNSLLDEYSVQYNAENGFTQLKNVMNAIYSSLAQYGDDYDIVPRLETIRVTFPNKNPSTPVGKFYKRYSKRLFQINKSIKEAELLYKKLVYNTKISDQRFAPLPTDMMASILDEQEYIYSDVSHFTNLGVDDQDGSIVAGYFFFDYEKALRIQSKLSSYLDINKLEMLGFNLPYNSFMVKQVSVNRAGSVNIMTSKVTDASIGMQKYPLIQNIDYNTIARFSAFYLTPRDQSTYGEDVSTSIFYGTAQSDSASDNAALGYITSLVNRSYAYTPSDAFDIENYRLMLYEILEYRKTYSDTGYDIDVTIHDDTLGQYENIFNIFSNYYSELSNYVSLADETCVYNNNLEKFNEYFIQNLLEQYEDTSDAIWYTAPIIYAIYLDILYDTYSGDMDAIEEASKAIVNAINPNIGNLESIVNFFESMTELYEVLNSMRLQIGGVNEDGETETAISIYRKPVAQDVVFSATIDIGEPQDKAYAGETETGEIIEVTPTKTITTYIEDWPTRGLNAANLYNEDGVALLTDIDIEQIVTVYFGQRIPGGTTETPVELPPENVENDGKKGNYSSGTGSDLIYEYNVDEKYFTVYKLGYWQIDYI
jgi:hypothetical protein